MEARELERLLAVVLHEALDPKQDRGDRLQAGAELQQLLAAAQRWLERCLDEIDGEGAQEPHLRDHLRGLQAEVACPQRAVPAPPVTPGANPLFQFRLQLPHEAASVPVCRLLLRLLLQELGVEADRADEIELALSEAVGNVIEHVQMMAAERYEVVVECFPDRVRFQVDDWGQGFRWSDRPTPGVEETGGRGLWLIEQLADELTVWTRAGGGCSLAAEFRLPAPLRCALLPGGHEAPAVVLEG